MTEPSKRRPLAASAVLFAFTLASCAPTPEGRPPPAAEASKPAVSTQPSTTPAPTPSTRAAATCQNIISTGTVNGLEELGWSAKESPFVIGETTLDDGISCAWADWTQTSDHGQVFAWAPLDAGTSAQLQSDLISQGWLREHGEACIYLTEDPDAALQTDDEGYGATYLFGDGWVTFADTRQSLILIEQR